MTTISARSLEVGEFITVTTFDATGQIVDVGETRLWHDGHYRTDVTVQEYPEQPERDFRRYALANGEFQFE